MAYEQQWDDENNEWVSYEPEESFLTNVVAPLESVAEGFDVVSFSAQTGAECSPLSCNHMAEEINVNENCLLPSFQEAKTLIETNTFCECEPGPYRIFEVHSVSI